MFVLGPIGLGYDRSNDRLLIQLEELLPTNEEGEEIGDADDRGHVRLFITRSQADAFCDHADEVVELGPSHLHVVRQPHRSRRARMSADELNAQLALLCTGEVEMLGRMPWSSNATFLVEVTSAGTAHRAIYKPVRGERPLWDFEPGPPPAGDRRLPALGVDWVGGSCRRR